MSDTEKDGEFVHMKYRRFKDQRKLLKRDKNRHVCPYPSKEEGKSNKE